MLTDAWTPLRYHEAQSRAWRTTNRFVALACGRGSGKTELARRRVIRYLPVKKDWPDPLYFYALPTVSQAKRVAWDKLLQLIPPSWIAGNPHVSEMYIETIFGSKLYVVGMDKPERLEGVQWDGGIIDESSDVRPGAFNRSVVPALEHKNAWCWRIGVPKRYGIGAAEYKEFFDKGLSDPGADTLSLSWPSEDILTPQQIKWAMENLDPADFDEQYRANWQSTGGTIFYNFEDANIDGSIGYMPNMPLVVGSDFNVDPMSWVVGHRFNNELHIFDEIFLRNTNTPKTLDNLHERYGQHESWEFYGDASGAARKTSAAKSDYLHIKGDERFKGASLYYPKKNPFIADRFAACNALFLSAAGKRRVKIHPRCVNLIKDLKYRAYKEGTREPDDHHDLGHMSDAFGYIVSRRFPLKINPHSKPNVSVVRS